MKTILGIFLVAANMLFVFAQSWSSASANLTIGNGQSIASTTDKQGIHVLYFASGTLKYARLTSSGSVSVSNVTVATGIGSFAAVTSYNDKIYAVYEKNTDVYIAKSTDGGSNWSSAIGAYSRTNTFGSLSATSDFNGVHVAWTEYGGGNEAYYALAKVGIETPAWDYFKEVSDYSNHTAINQSIAVSADEVHVTYQTPAGSAKTRDFLISQGTPSWEDPVTLEYSPVGYVTNNRTVVVGNNVHVICLEYYYIGESYTYNVRHYVRAVNSSSFATTNLSDQHKSGDVLRMTKTNNGDLHMLYQKRFDGEPLIHVKYDGSSWSTVTTGLSTMTPFELSSAGNDLFLAQQDNFYSDKLSYRQYDATPTVPTGMAIGAPNQLTVNWTYNPEPDIQYYEVWRKYWRSQFDNEDWTLKTTRTTNSWTDPDFQLSSGGDIYTVYYKTKAKDNANQLSAYSGETSTSAYMVFGKQGTLAADGNIPKKFEAKQNYPNPFNPTTSITFSLPEPSQTSLIVYDEVGREVAKLFDGYLIAGTFSATFDASKFSSGVYFYTINAGSYTASKRMLLIK